MPWASLASIPLSIPHNIFVDLLLVCDLVCSLQRGPGRVIITVRGALSVGDTLKVVVQDPRIAEEVCPARPLVPLLSPASNFPFPCPWYSDVAHNISHICSDHQTIDDEESFVG